MMAKKAKLPVCKCVETVNDKLRDIGFSLRRHMQINFTTKMAGLSPPCVEVFRHDTKKRGKIPTVLCAFCPFCGKKL